MNPDDRRRGALASSWERNAGVWTEAVRTAAIASRALATDRAIVEATLAGGPGRVLDLGCGEGWLVRALLARGIDHCVGVDGSAALIAAAVAADPSPDRYRCLPYAALADAGLGRFDRIVANFALLDDQLPATLAAITPLLVDAGLVLIQTLHPRAVPEPDRDGWREEDFRGLTGSTGAEPGWAPMPWYFRTLESWVAALDDAGLVLDGLSEPRDPRSGAPASVLLRARLRPDRSRP